MFGSSRVLLWIAVLGVGLFSLPAVARQGGDDDDPYLPGLAATYRDAQGRTAVRLDRRLAFHWGETSPDARLGACDFRALWQGYLFASPRGDFRFHIFGSDEIELKIGGKVVVAWQTGARCARTVRSPAESR